MIVNFEIPELNYKTNMNFNPQQFEGLTKDQIKAEIKRHLKRHYREKIRENDPAVKKDLDDAVTEMEGIEIE